MTAWGPLWEQHFKKRHRGRWHGDAEDDGLQRSETLEKRRLEAIRKTGGCLSEEDAEDFARAVEEGGRDISDSHDW
jgi:hypothetical protein